MKARGKRDSGMVRGIGPVLARRIVSAFGEGTFDIIEASPEKLREVPGIGEFRAGKIAAGLGRTEGHP